MKRPNLQRMINDLPKLDAIVFTRIDRLSRNVLEANKLLQLLKQNNTDMIAIKEENVDTTTSNGMFLFNLKLSLAQHELDRGSERIKAVFEYKVREGEAVTGSLPFGYKIGEKDGKKVIIKDKETEAIVNDANLGAKDMKYMHEKTCLLYWDGQAGRNSLTAPCAMKVVRLNYGDTNSASGVGIYEREDEARDVQILRVKQRFVPIVQYKEAAVLLKQCI